MMREIIEKIVDLVFSSDVAISFPYTSTDILSSADKLENLYYGSGSYKITVCKDGIYKHYDTLTSSVDKETFIKCLENLDEDNIATELDEILKQRRWEIEEIKYFKEGSAKLRKFRDDVIALKESKKQIS